MESSSSWLSLLSSSSSPTSPPLPLSSSSSSSSSLAPSVAPLSLPFASNLSASNLSSVVGSLLHSVLNHSMPVTNESHAQTLIQRLAGHHELTLSQALETQAQALHHAMQVSELQQQQHQQQQHEQPTTHHHHHHHHNQHDDQQQQLQLQLQLQHHNQSSSDSASSSGAASATSAAGNNYNHSGTCNHVSSDASVRIVLTVVYTLILFTGVIGNLCTCAVIADKRNRYMKTATNFYLFSLSVSDLLLVATGAPIDLIALWRPCPYPFTQFVCVARGWLSEASTYASVLVIVAFTVERYLAICHPLRAHKMSRLSRAVKIIIAIWIIAALSAVKVASQFGLQYARNALDEIDMDSAECTILNTSETAFELTTLIFFIIPMCVITVLYCAIGYELRQMVACMSTVSPSATTGTSSTPTPGGVLRTRSQYYHKPGLHHSKMIRNTNNAQTSAAAASVSSRSSIEFRTASVSDTMLCSSPIDARRTASNSNNNNRAITKHLPGQRQYSNCLSPINTTVESIDTHTTAKTNNSNNVSNNSSPAVCVTMSPSPSAPSILTVATATATTATTVTTAAIAATAVTNANKNENKNGYKDITVDTSAATPVATITRATSLSTVLSNSDNPTLAAPSSSNDKLNTNGNNNNGAHYEQLETSELPNSVTITLNGPMNGEPMKVASQLANNNQIVDQQRRENIDADANDDHVINERGATSNAEAHNDRFTFKLSNHRNNNNTSLRHNHNYHHNHNYRFKDDNNSSISTTTINHTSIHQYNGKSKHISAADNSPSERFERRKQILRLTNSSSSNRQSVVKMLVAVVVMFFLCWAPFHAQRLMAIYIRLPTPGQVTVYNLLNHISGVSYYLSASVNPILYSLLSVKFRQAFVDTFGSRCGSSCGYL